MNITTPFALNNNADESIGKSISKINKLVKTPKNKHLKKALIPLFAVSVVIGTIDFVGENEVAESPCLEMPTTLHGVIQRNGKPVFPTKLNEVFTPTNWQDLGFPVITEELKLALQHQLHVLEKSDIEETNKMGNLAVSYGDMRDVLEFLILRAGTQPNDLHQYLDAYQTKGEDGMGNVHFTGYFTPVLKVKKHKDGKYKYPIYSFPEDWKCSLPSRREIDKKGALKGKGLELAYAANPLDVYFMQLQGSGTVEFLDTNERVLLRYAGENGHRYKNIQFFFKKRGDLALTNLSPESIRRFLLKHPEKTDSVLFYDPSYTFFEPKKGLAKGAANVPLMPGISIAADSRYFPLGSVVLAALPIYNNGKITHHEYKLLLPQDVGGAIKGAGHVDVYCGNGEIGQNKASGMHHYGKLWVLLPKKNEQVALLQ